MAHLVVNMLIEVDVDDEVLEEYDGAEDWANESIFVNTDRDGKHLEYEVDWVTVE